MTQQLTDQFGRIHRYLRISITDRCNLRCVYCMPAEGFAWQPREEILSYEEIVRMARIFVDLGVNKVRITGGEPTVRRHVEDLIGELAAIEGIDFLAMTTNGLTLEKNATLYRQRGLNGLNISLDSMRPERFAQITRRDELPQVLAGIDAALSAGFDPIKINMVVMAGINDDEILDFVAFAQDKPVNMRFIEFMPFQSNGWSPQGLVPYRHIRETIETQTPLIPIRTEPSAVAKDFAIEGYQGTVSFITSMTENFCATCNRVRLTADGSIKSCLFHPAEVNLRSHLRDGTSDTELAQIVQQVVFQKPAGHAPMAELVGTANRSMIAIGG